NGGSSWVRQDQGITPGTLYSVDIGTNISAWAVGYTNNQTSLVMNYLGGGVWDQESQSIGANSITGIAMLSGSVGYAVSSPFTTLQPKFYSTVNGGFTWTGNTFVDLLGNPLFTTGTNEVNSIQFVNQNNGWIAGTNNGYAVLYKTSNNGNAWFAPNSINTAPAAPSELFCVRFNGPVTGYAVGVQTGQPSLYYTVDAGADWTSPVSGVPSAPGQLNSVTIQPASGIAGGFTGTVGSPTTLILTTTDGGANWNQQSVGSGNILAVTSTTSDSAWFGGTWTGGAFIYYTSNATTGTPTWNRANLPFNGMSVQSISFINSQIGYAVGKNTSGGEWIIYSTDGGQNWNQLIDPVLGGSLNSISTVLSNEVDFWTAGSNETILHGKILMPIAYSYPPSLFNTIYPNEGGANDIYRTTSDTARTYLALANNGSAPLTINPNSLYWTNTTDGNVPQDYILPSQLSAGSPTLTIPPGVIDSLLIVFAPKNFGPRSGTLNIPSNSALGNTMQFSLLGFEGPSSIQFDTTVRGSMNPLSMHNDTVSIGQFMNDTLYISNLNGTSRLNIKKAVITGQDAGEYSIVGGIQTPIEVGSRAKLVVRFSPVAGFNRLARLDITSDASNDSSQIVLLNGYGSCTEDAMIGADTLFLNDTLTYQTSNDSLIEHLIFCNTCSSPVTVDSQAIYGDPFDYSIVTPLPTTVAPGVCDTVAILFSPNLGSSAVRDAQFIVRTNARTTNTLTRQLDGIGCTQFVSVSPTAFSGDTVHVGDSVIYKSLVTNTGVCPIQIDSLKFAGNNGYTVISTPTGSLAPGASDTIVVVFKPSTPDTTVNGLLHVYTNATNSPLDSISYTNSTLVSSVLEPGVIASDYMLSQNYPNPFGPATVIRYAVPTRQMVTVDIINSIGQVVAIPVNEVEEAGLYHFTFNAGNLPNGIYIYRMHAGTTTISRTMSIVR
ncbi:MAG TPA: choice-of-anchor D domain-containing protein, partial [Candidatus Kapabacteria bacterium]|nr:choice-of-anchor D domain-containing protein [Candidatus Kapabacteria bacterium]